jgi:hypothetical protein
MRYFKSVVALGAVIGAFGSNAVAQAQNFASFSFTNTSTKLLYLDGTQGGQVADRLALGTVNSTGQVTQVTSAQSNFSYLVNNGAFAPNTSVLANVSLGAVSTTNVLPSSNTELFTNVVISFTNANTLTSLNGSVFAANSVNLLTLTVAGTTGATGTLSNLINNAQTLNFSGAIARGDVIGYTSDFLDFTGTAAGNTYNVDITNARKLADNSAGIRVQGANADSFYGDVALGTFGAGGIPGRLDPTPAPPGVVSALIGIAMGGAQFGAMKFRRRRAKKTEAAETAA